MSGPAIAPVVSPRPAARAPARRRERIVFHGASTGAPLQHALEEQARRVAHTLHDETGQLLTTISLAVDNLGREFPTAAARLRTIKDLVAMAELQLRRVVYELRPTILEHLGLVPAVRTLVDSVRQEAGVHVVFEVAISRQLAAEVAVALYRMIQEGLTNAIRHGGAGCVRIRIRTRRDAVRCTVEDDGSGFDVRAVAAAAPGRLGLLGMRERITALGGTLTLASSPGAGAELSATIPLEVVRCP